MDSSPADPAPDPPWWEVPRRAEARSTLTRDAVVAAALRVLDEVGMERFTMRRVADELDTGAATLYWHVTDKDQLIHLVLDRVMEEIELPPPDPTRWEDQVRQFAHAGQTVLRRHPGVALASLGRIPAGPNLVRIMEWFLGVLVGAGIPVQAASWFADLLALVGAAQAVEDQLASTGDPALTEMDDYMATLPTDRFPNLTTHASEMTSGGPDDRSEFAIELLIRGLATFVEERADTGHPGGRHHTQR